MTSLAEMFVALRPDGRTFQPEADKIIRKTNTDRSGRQLGIGLSKSIGGGLRVGLGGAFKSAFLPVVAAAGALGGVQAFAGFVNDARESAKISRITANAIRATGGAAKITAAQVGDLATATSNKTGIDDEQVQTAANMLLTFKQIRNETGKGNDVFNQATQAAADLSVQFGGIDAASKQLGKALNDPIKGTTALAKSGVTFTAQQKEQIKTLVESGRTLEAQKIILKEINSQVGGAAAAAADPLDRLKVVAGNLGEEIGGFLLPHVERFSNFVSDKVIPGVSGLANLLFKGDFTTQLREAFNVEEDSGFVRFLLNARDTAITVFNEIRGGITAFASAWKFNDGEVTSSGFPGFMERLGYFARQTFDFFKAEVLPRLREFAGYVRDTVIPIIGAFITDSLDKLRGVFNTVKQAISDNRPQLEQLAGAMQKVAKFIIEKLVPFLAKVGNETLPALGVAIGFAVRSIGGIVSAFNAIKEPARIALRFVVDRFLGFVENILTGAAKAFGWVPELGGKLKGAAAEFRKFRDGVNRSLDGIDDEAIKVALSYSAKGVNLSAPSSVGRSAIGGKLRGPGTGTSDSILRRVSNGEWVIKAKSSQKYGDYAMASVNAGTATILPGLATGGRPGLNLRSVIPAEGPINATATAIAQQFGRAIGRELTATGGPSGPPGAVQSFRGERLNARTIRMLIAAERILGQAFRIMQGSYSTRVAASGGTHAGGGAMDVNGPGGWSRSVSALRRVGFAAWHRTPAQGPWGHHIHAIAIGDPTASPSARRQVRDFLRGGDGLGGMALGGKVVIRDNGGPLPSGMFAYNGSGKTETVRTAEQEAQLRGSILDAATLEKAFTRALDRARVRLVAGPGGAYTLQFTNG